MPSLQWSRIFMAKHSIATMQSTPPSSSSLSSLPTNNNDKNHNRARNTILLILILAFDLFYVGNFKLRDFNNTILTALSMEQAQIDGYHNQTRKNTGKNIVETSTSASTNQENNNHIIKQKGGRISQDEKTDYFSCTLRDGSNVTLPVSVPHFIIIGAQKGGTTSLYQIFSQLPNMIAANRIEAHFFDMRSRIRYNNADGLAISTPNEICESRKRYAEFWPTTIPPLVRYAANIDTGSTDSLLFHDPSKYLTFEKTPSYSIKHTVPRFIVELLYPHKPKIIMMLRDPIDRAFSQYRMDKTARKAHVGNKSFEEIVQEEMANWSKYGLIQMSHELPSNWTDNDDGNISFPEMSIPEKLTLRQQLDTKLQGQFLRRGTYVYQIQNWLQHFELHTELMLVNYDHYRQNQTLTLTQMLHFLGVKDDIQDLISLDQLNKDYSPKQSSDHQQIDVSSRSNKEIVLKNSTRLFLQKLYKPYNDMLANLLGEEWRVWGY